MDCKTALQILELDRPADRGAANGDVAGAASHVERCPDCMMQMESRRGFDAELAVAMQSVSIPAGLSDRIHTRLQESRPRRWIMRRRTAWSLAAALAAGLIVAATVHFWQASPPPPIELDAQQLGDLVIIDPSLIEDLKLSSDPFDDAAPARVWCSKQTRSLKLSANPPQYWPAQALVAVGRSSILGRRVAIFRFQDDRGESDVLAFPHSEFQIAHLRKGVQFVTRTRNLVAITWTENDTTYVAVLKGWSSDDWRPLVQHAVDLT